MEPITSETVVAYCRCPREAFLLLCAHKKGDPHAYRQHIDKQRTSFRTQYLAKMKLRNTNMKDYEAAELQTPNCILTDAVVTTENLEGVL